jgi:flavorubredoxin
MITNAQSNTTLDEIAEGIYRISTPAGEVPGGFSFNQYLVLDEQPLLFHTGPRPMSGLVQEAISRVTPVARLRWIAFSHHENDESGAMNELLAAAPHAAPVCGAIGVMVGAGVFDRPARALADGEALALGTHVVRWFDAPHVPHGWDCGFLFESRTRTLLCGDLFTQPGAEHAPLLESDILGPSEEMRKAMDYFSHNPQTRATIERLAATEPETLACMHGSAWRGDGAALLRALAQAVTQDDLATRAAVR